MEAINDYVRHPDTRILAVLVGLAAWQRRSWANVSQVKTLQLLEQRYRRRMSRRNLNRHLGALERDGLIRRIRRHRRGPGGRIDMHCTAYSIRHRARRLFANLSPALNLFLADLKARFSLSAVPAPAQCGTPISTLLAGGVAKGAPPSG
jgi:DNA-binding MarR family transcriptional regulator